MQSVLQYKCSILRIFQTRAGIFLLYYHYNNVKPAHAEKKVQPSVIKSFYSYLLLPYGRHFMGNISSAICEVISKFDAIWTFQTGAPQK